MADKLVTKFLYIDTSVFEWRQFDLQSTALTALLTLAKAGLARLLTSSVTVGECRKHMKARVSQAATDRKNLAAEAWILKRFSEYAVLFEKPDKDALADRLIKQFDDYLSGANAEHIDLTNANITGIIDQYFAETPPFGAGDKKAEFPDAIVLSALSTWCERKKESVYVITRDKKMRDACTPAIGLYALTDVTDFLDLANSHEEVAAERIKTIFRARAASLVRDVEDGFHDLEFWVRDYEADVEIESIERVTFSDPEIVTIDEYQATIEVECEVTFTATITYEDPTTGIWDSEDQRMLYMQEVHKTVRDTDSASVEILFQYDSFSSLANPDEPEVSVMSVVRLRPIILRV